MLCVGLLLATNSDGVALLGDSLVAGGTHLHGERRHVKHARGELVPFSYTRMLAPVFFFTFFVVLLFFFLGDDDDLGRSAKC